ncbi:MAG: hypothetical protein Q8K32_28290 [Archangium sp.]|nr:hypothetical protein [Archangium sp.]
MDETLARVDRPLQLHRVREPGSITSKLEKEHEGAQPEAATSKTARSIRTVCAIVVSCLPW